MNTPNLVSSAPNGEPHKTPPTGSPGTSLWDRLRAWLMRPIEFPGKWPVINRPAETYNREEQSDSLHDRMTNQ
jgi:hypothetical protein